MCPNYDRTYMNVASEGFGMEPYVESGGTSEICRCSFHQNTDLLPHTTAAVSAVAQNISEATMQLQKALERVRYIESGGTSEICRCSFDQNTVLLPHTSAAVHTVA